MDNSRKCFIFVPKINSKKQLDKMNEYIETLLKDLDNPSEILKGEQNGFLMSLMVISSYVIQADGKIMHSEMEFVRRFLFEYFGEEKKSRYEKVLLALFSESKKYGNEAWKQKIEQVTRRIVTYTTIEQRQLLLAFVIRIVRADRSVDSSEIKVTQEVAQWLDISIEAARSIDVLRKDSNWTWTL